MDWTNERVKLLKSYVAAELSCSEIAEKMGVSRNAIIGKIHRLGLTPTKRPPRPRISTPQVPRPPKPRRLRVLSVKEATRIASSPPPLTAAEVEAIITATKPAKLSGPAEPFHMSRAFPKPEECGLSLGILFAISTMYPRPTVGA